jgi:polysaccharide biosynthesis transport protein
MGKLSSLQLAFKRHAWAGLLTSASVLGTAWIYLGLTVPRYEASTRLLIEQKQASVSELGRSLTRLPENVPGGSSPIATQAELIKSQRVLEQALAALGTTTATGQGATGPTAIGKTNSAKAEPPLTADKVSKGLKIKILPATNILELSFQSPDKELAAKLLNQIAAATVKESSESIRREASSVREFLEVRLPEQQALLEAAEAAESQYRQATGIVALDAQTTGLVNSLSELDTQIRTVAAQMQESRSRNGQLQQVIGVDNPTVAYAAARVGQDEQLRSLRVRLVDLEAKVIENGARLGDQHPDLLALKEQRDQTKNLYTQRVSAVLNPAQAAPSSSTEATNDVSRDLVSRYIVGEVEGNALEQRLKAAKGERIGLQSRLAQLPVQQQNFTVLTRKREEASVTLRQLQNNLEQARIAEAQLISNVRVLDAAQVPLAPATPQPNAVWAVALAASGILATGMILLLEALDGKLRTSDEVKPLLDLAVLATLPKLTPALNVDRLEDFLNQPDRLEPYRLLLKTLHRPDRPVKLLVVTSTLTGEGKSDFVARLAAVSSALSWRTLVIDADLRHPLQHKLFGLSDIPGLTHIVLDQKPLADTIQATSLENLAVLTHGDAVSRPVKITESAALQTLLAEAKANFDLVIVDAAPLQGCADVVALSQTADGIILVARPDFISKKAIQTAVADIRATHTEILGVVLSRTPDRFTGNFPSARPVAQPPLMPPLLMSRSAPSNGLTLEQKAKQR